MLAVGHRLTRRADFTSTTRSGVRFGMPSLVVHLLLTDSADPARVGFAVSRAVGNSVVRHRVTRRLRAVSATLVEQLPTGALVVVRALPASAAAPSAQLADEFARALTGALTKAGAR